MINKLWNLILALIGFSLSSATMIAFDILPAYTAIYGATCMFGGYIICMMVNSSEDKSNDRQ